MRCYEDFGCFGRPFWIFLYVFDLLWPSCYLQLINKPQLNKLCTYIEVKNYLIFSTFFCIAMRILVAMDGHLDFLITLTSCGNTGTFIISRPWFTRNMHDKCTYVTCYHNMSVKSPVCLQRYSLLNMPQNKRKQRKIIAKYWLLLDKTRSYTHISYIILKLALWRTCISNNFE